MILDEAQWDDNKTVTCNYPHCQTETRDDSFQETTRMDLPTPAHTSTQHHTVSFNSPIILESLQVSPNSKSKLSGPVVAGHFIEWMPFLSPNQMKDEIHIQHKSY